MNILDIAMRWLHLMSAIAAAGTTIFALFVLVPVLRESPEDVQTRLHDAIRPRMAKLVSISIGLLLISGFYNYLAVKMPLHEGQGLYHGLMGGKILLAFVVFFIASALTGKAKAFESLRAQRAKWLTINVLLVMAIVVIGGVLRLQQDNTAAMP